MLYFKSSLPPFLQKLSFLLSSFPKNLSQNNLERNPLNCHFIFLLDVNFTNSLLDCILFLYPQYLQNFKNIKDQQ